MRKPSARQSILVLVLLTSLVTSTAFSAKTSKASSSNSSEAQWSPPLSRVGNAHTFLLEDDFYVRAEQQGFFTSCASSTTTGCILAVTASIGQEVYTASLIRQEPPLSRCNVFSRSNQPLCSPNGPGLWRFNSGPRSLDGDFVVAATTSSTSGLDLSITPVETFAPDGGTGSDPINGITTSDLTLVHRCIYASDNQSCLRRRDFRSDAKFSVTLNLEKEPDGFFQARLRQPSLHIKQQDDFVQLSIAGGPIAVPTVSATTNWTDIPAEIQADWRSGCTSTRTGSIACGVVGASTITPSNIDHSSQPVYSPINLETGAVIAQTTYKYFQKFLPLTGNRAAALPKYWRAQLRKPTFGSRAHSCLYLPSGTTGLVSSNATVLEEGPPFFDEESKQLLYTSATVHFEPDGTTVFNGELDVILRADVASCLYDFEESFATSGSSYSTEVVVPNVPDSDEFTEESESIVEVDRDAAVASETSSFLSEIEDGIGGNPITTQARLVLTRQSTDLSSTEIPTRGVDFDGEWFSFGASGFSFSTPTIGSRLSVRPYAPRWCFKAGAVFRVVTSKGSCPPGLLSTTTRFCRSKNQVTAVISPRPQCPAGSKSVKVLECGKGAKALRVFGIQPRCPSGTIQLKPLTCAKGFDARVIRAAKPTCRNGFKQAIYVKCRKGGRIYTIATSTPLCPKGYRKL